MNNRPSVFSVLAPFLLILIAGFVYYAKYHWARTWVDERIPWVKENIGSRLPSLVIAVDANGNPIEESSAATGATNGGESTALTARYVSGAGVIDLAAFAADRASWPKTVKLRKAREFPAVVDGKAVGKIEAPAGSEARLVAVQAGKLGLEFRGGGAWITPEETDLAMRLRGTVQ